ncbi:UPF0234 protein [Propionispora sp. 2/2-37]|uniref:YajQ family cyclic di-GMP-binding protein n=1 Tax=Propionispora sp. 2/2-37 TaxID=1677858 RepID=UPI0006BB7CAE|nr:YajQ family cyclic di-GMP-binding protein [Propionispora sp. 2/2-37]CUH97851.1 UPF0234 protein [Propionispora sp. 2/2-37]
MAKDCSFDIVSTVELQELDNAVNQTVKEISQRFDFRGSKASVTLDNGEIKVIGDDEYKLQSVIDVLHTKLVKRGISLKNLDYGKIEPAAQGTARQMIKIKQGINRDTAKEIVSAIKDTKSKVQAQIMDDQVRVSGKNKDDLQHIITTLKQKDFSVELQFVNFRS